MVHLVVLFVALLLTTINTKRFGAMWLVMKSYLKSKLPTHFLGFAPLGSLSLKPVVAANKLHLTLRNSHHNPKHLC